jgi:hypothetical protein
VGLGMSLALVTVHVRVAERAGAFGLNRGLWPDV